MDQLSDIYANIERPSGNRCKRKRMVKSDVNIYANADEIHTQDPNRTGPTLSGAEDVKKSSCRAAAVCLGLLCLLLLAGLITLVFLFIQGNSELEMEMVLLQTSYNNLTKERDQLQTSYNNLTKERDQLQTSYNHLAEERDQLQKRVEDMTKERNDLQRKLQENMCCDDWRKFGTSCYYISTEEKTWEESRKECQRKGADLVVINSEEEQKFVIEFNKRVWIGLTDQDEEGVWKWVDGTTLTTKYWYSPQPDNNGGQGNKEDCAEIYIDNPDPLLKWNDAYCLHRTYWSCEMIMRVR